MESEELVRKIIFEARFKANIGFFDVRNKLAQSFSKEFPDWLYDAVTTRMFNKKEHYHLMMDSKRIGFDFDRNGLFRDAKDQIIKISKKINDTLSIELFERLGLRMFLVHPTTMSYEELNKIFDTKMLSQSDKFRDIYSSKIKEYAVAIDFERDGFSFNMAIGTTKKEESYKRIPFNPSIFSADDRKDMQSTISEANIFIDLDCYKLDIKSTYFKNYVEEAFIKSNQILNEMLKYLLD